MVLNKILGYVISIVGVIILAIGVMKPIRVALTFIPASITEMYFMIAGLVIVVVGIFLIYKSPSRDKVSELPIYSGKDVVGFRRVGKK